MIPLPPYPRPGFFITATGTDIGKTVVTAALAAAFRRLNVRVGICKPINSGCPPIPGRENATSALSDDDLIPQDALLPAQSAGLDITDTSLMQHASPARFQTPVSPHLAARLENRPTNWPRIAAAFDYWKTHADLLLVEGAGGWLTPLDDQDHTIADLAAALALPIILVTSPHLGTLNATLLTVESIRRRTPPTPPLPLAGLIINRAPPPESQELATQSNLTELPRLTNLPLLAILPNLPTPPTHPLPDTLITPLLPFAKSHRP